MDLVFDFYESIKIQYYRTPIKNRTYKVKKKIRQLWVTLCCTLIIIEYVIAMELNYIHSN